MLLDKVQLAVADACHTEKGRFAINALCVEPDGTVVATDGRRLLTVGPNTVEVDNWPDAKAAPVKLDARVLLPAKLCAAARKRIGRGSSANPAMDCAAVTAADGETVELATTKHAGSCCSKVKTMRESEPQPDGSFPPWEDMIPEDADSDITVSLDPRMLADTLRTMATMLDAAGMEHAVVTFAVRGPEKPIVIRAKLGKNRVATAVVAPLRVKS